MGTGRWRGCGVVRLGDGCVGGTITEGGEGRRLVAAHTLCPCLRTRKRIGTHIYTHTQVHTPTSTTATVAWTMLSGKCDHRGASAHPLASSVSQFR